MKLSRRQIRQIISEELTRVAESNTGITKGRHWALSPMTGEKHWGGMASEEELVGAGQRSRDAGHAIHYDPPESGMPDLDWPSDDQNDYEAGRQAGRNKAGVPEEHYGNLDFLTGYTQGLEDTMTRQSREGQNRGGG